MSSPKFFLGIAITSVLCQTPVPAQNNSLAINIDARSQFEAVWVLKRPEAGFETVVEKDGTSKSYQVSDEERLNQMPWGRERLVEFQKLSKKLKGIHGRTVYWPMHNDTEDRVRLIAIRSQFVKTFKDLTWPDGFVDPQPVAWTHLTYAAINNYALPGGHKDGKKYGCWIIKPEAFEKKIISFDTLLEQGLVNNSGVLSMSKVFPPQRFRGYIDTSKTDPWCAKHYPGYVTAFSTGRLVDKVGNGVMARYTKAEFLFLKEEAGYRVECHRSIPNAVIRFPVDQKVSEVANKDVAMELKLPFGQYAPNNPNGNNSADSIGGNTNEILAPLQNRTIKEEVQ